MLNDIKHDSYLQPYFEMAARKKRNYNAYLQLIAAIAAIFHKLSYKEIIKISYRKVRKNACLWLQYLQDINLTSSLTRSHFTKWLQMAARIGVAYTPVYINKQVSERNLNSG